MSANLVGQTLLNRFYVEEFIDAGRMGTVYSVWDREMNVYLAMKVLHADLADDPSVLKLFQREANALKRLWYGLVLRLTPEPLEPTTTPPGYWREYRKRGGKTRVRLFDTILVAVPGVEGSWNALEAALFIADNEKAAINGLHILRAKSKRHEMRLEQNRTRFDERCQQISIEAQLAAEMGQVSREIQERARTYLEGLGIRIVNYLESQGNPGSVILKVAQACGCDMFVMGDYESHLFKEMLKGSTVDKVLRGTKHIVMVCR